MDKLLREIILLIVMLFTCGVEVYTVFLYFGRMCEFKFERRHKIIAAATYGALLFSHAYIKSIPLRTISMLGAVAVIAFVLHKGSLWRKIMSFTMYLAVMFLCDGLIALVAAQLNPEYAAIDTAGASFQDALLPVIAKVATFAALWGISSALRKKDIPKKERMTR